jgi:cobalt/nickel transport system permease protein
MHIPDGFLSTPVWAGLDAAAAPAVGYLARKAQQGMDDSRAPLLGVMGAFVFAAQMINFPVGAGTSGHLVGGALLACTLGPSAAVVVMTAILVIQALMFQDGGLLALGANVMNMGVAGVLAGYVPYHLWGRGRGRKAAVFAGGVLSVVVAACLTLGELRFSGVAMPPAIIGLSFGLFLVTAVIEGAITLAVFEALERMNPTWVRSPAEPPKRGMRLVLAAALVLGCFGALLASGMPDGLESLAEKVGIASRAQNMFETPLLDYEIRSLSAGWAGKAAAGLVGLAAIYLVCIAAARLLARRSRV